MCRAVVCFCSSLFHYSRSFHLNIKYILLQYRYSLPQGNYSIQNILEFWTISTRTCIKIIYRLPAQSELDTILVLSYDNNMWWTHWKIIFHSNCDWIPIIISSSDGIISYYLHWPNDRGIAMKSCFNVSINKYCCLNAAEFQFSNENKKENSFAISILKIFGIVCISMLFLPLRYRFSLLFGDLLI